MAFGRFGALTSLINLCFLIWGFWMLMRLGIASSRHIRKVRNRLIVSYLFVAVVPITLTIAFLLVAGWLLGSEFAGYMVTSAIEHREAEIRTPARLLARELPADRLAIVQQLTATGALGVQALVTGGPEFRYPANADIQMPAAEWSDYTGVVYRNGQPWLMALVANGQNRALILEPLSNDVLANLVPGLGSVGLSEGAAGGYVKSYNSAIAGRVPPRVNLFDVVIQGLAPVDVANWDRPNAVSKQVIVVVTRLSTVVAVALPGGPDISDVARYALYAIVFLLVAAEVVSIFIGVSITATITGAVHNLYAGTTKIGGGDFSHRIPVRGNDQLADLGRSFNDMAGQLEQFVAVTKEKERLQSELAIASEVQTRLFPHKPPPSNDVEMLGVCHAARMVSGDYYDYFTAADGELAIALGDVAGKGISAALLMASIQSIMRTQLSGGVGPMSPSATVERLNRLLYASTAPEKYATFFFGLYNPEKRHVVYTNAGHLQPILIRGDSWQLLEVTGSVVGAFPALRYEERSVPLEPGDMLIAYTDGITEPENDYGEEFGVERLADIAIRNRDAAPAVIVEKVLEAVRAWSASPEQADDMTLLLVKGVSK